MPRTQLFGRFDLTAFYSGSALVACLAASAVCAAAAAATQAAATQAPAGEGAKPATRPATRADAQQLGPVARPQDQGRLTFQTQEGYRPRVHLNSDIAMVYGIDKTLPERIQTWRKHGYTIQVMTGVAWGEYQDYYFGRWDGQNHEDEIQTMQNGERIGHGGDVFYMAPGEKYGTYLTQGVKRALDAGATAIHLEEPEFWVRAGWSEGFKRSWQEYYKEPWQDPVSSPEAQYRASKLKYYLYRRALAQVFDYVKKYGKEHGRTIPCYVPTHSLINYASWGIVSPESSLLEVGCDGYIAQVWTGTARTPNFYKGVEKQRTFETAFLEYGAMQNLVRASGRRVWYLNDPIEDNPDHSWFDYRTNWESTLVASLLQPEVYHYEIMPWPHRIFGKDYPATQPGTGNARRDVKRVPIPEEYATELQAVISAMGDMKQPADQIKWEHAGTRRVGVLVSDTMMFQRFGPDASDPQLGSFYGLALPLLMHGIPVEPVQMETADLSNYDALLLTYEGQKPPTEAFHERLVKWLKGGGKLFIMDDDKDPYNKVREWWNTGGMHYDTPRHHLFELMGMQPNDRAGGPAGVMGAFGYMPESPAAMSKSKESGDAALDGLQFLCDISGGKIKFEKSSALVLRRGHYLIAAGLEKADGEGRDALAPVTLTGRFIPLFDSTQTLIKTLDVGPGVRALLVDVDAFPKGHVGVVAAACRVREQTVTDQKITLQTDGQARTRAVVSLMLPKAPKAIRVAGKPLPADAFDYADGLLRVRFGNEPDGAKVEIDR